MQILTSAFVILEVLALFNVLIFVHELGHFLAAKWRGLEDRAFCHLVRHADLEKEN